MANEHLYPYERIKEDDHQALRDLIIIRTDDLMTKLEKTNENIIFLMKRFITTDDKIDGIEKRLNKLNGDS